MKTQQTMTKDLTQGSVPGQLFFFSMPLLAANTLQAIYNLVDMVIVGRIIGGSGMSAVAIGGDILHLLTFLAIGFTSAGQVIIAQHVGAGKTEEIRRLIGTMFSSLLGTAVLMSVCCFTLRDWILGSLHTPIESYHYSMDYLVTCGAGLVFIYGYNIVSAILRGMGDSRRPFLFVAIAAVLNIILDLVFVAGMHMEVFGAALATVMGQGISFIISLIYLYRNRRSFGFDFQPASFRIDPPALKQLLRLGLPMAIQQAAISISRIILMRWINAEGVVYSALAGIYSKIALMMAVVTNSFTTAGSSMVGQSIGAGKYERVPRILKTITAAGLVVAFCSSIIVLSFPVQVCSLFTSDARVLKASAVIIMPAVFNIFGFVLRSPAFSIINGTGHVKMNLLIAILDGMFARVLIAAFLGFRLGLGCKGFWYGDALAGFVPVMIGTCFYLSGHWRMK